VARFQDDGQRKGWRDVRIALGGMWMGAKRIVPPLRGFTVLQYRPPTAVAVGYAVPPLAGLDKEKTPSFTFQEGLALRFEEWAPEISARSVPWEILAVILSAAKNPS